MNDKNPYDDLLEQLNQLLQLVHDCSNKTVDPLHVPIDFEKKINKLEQDVENFKKMGDDIVALSGVSKAELQRRIEGTAEDIAPENQDLIKKATKLLSKAEQLEQSYLAGTAPPPVVQDATPEKELDDTQFRKRRRRKLKRFGGDQGWKPM